MLRGRVRVPAITDEQFERVRALVASIPEGRVATYGDIAQAVGLTNPRQVGWILREDSADLPWHRVVGASGRPARHLTAEQLARLRSEGVLAADGKISLRERRHVFPGGGPESSAGIRPAAGGLHPI
jgi:methylated-DNA-protein-cysteine methyltransferase-like protein